MTRLESLFWGKTLQGKTLMIGNHGGKIPRLVWYDHVGAIVRMARLEGLFEVQPQESKTQTTDNLVGIINRIVHF